MGRVVERPAVVEQTFPEVSQSILAAELERTGARYPACRCDLHVGMTRAQLVALGAGCTAARGYTCDRLAAVRRRCVR